MNTQDTVSLCLYQWERADRQSRLRETTIIMQWQRVCGSHLLCHVIDCAINIIIWPAVRETVDIQSWPRKTTIITQWQMHSQRVCSSHLLCHVIDCAINIIIRPAIMHHVTQHLAELAHLQRPIPILPITYKLQSHLQYSTHVQRTELTRNLCN